MTDGQKLYLVAHHELSFEPNFPQSGLFDPMEYPADFYKIGIAKNPKHRVSNMRSGTPHNLKLVTTVEADDAREIEQDLHSINAYGRHNGEWFKLTTNMVNSLKALDELSHDVVKGIKRENYIGDRDYDKSFYIRVMEARGDGR